LAHSVGLKAWINVPIRRQVGLDGSLGSFSEQTAWLNPTPLHVQSDGSRSRKRTWGPLAIELDLVASRYLLAGDRDGRGWGNARWRCCIAMSNDKFSAVSNPVLFQMKTSPRFLGSNCVTHIF
jgi:hypothetical protein